jgi:hypothetical protein
MKLAVFFLLFFFFFLPAIVKAASVGVGAEPTVIRLTLSNSRPMQNVSIFINNPSTITHDNYTFSISDNLIDHLHWSCSEAGYDNSWCIDKSYFVAANTPRPGHEVIFTFLKRNNAEEVFNGTITAKANPIRSSGGTVGLSPTVSIRIEMTQVNEVTSTSTTTSVPTTIATTTASTSSPTTTTASWWNWPTINTTSTSTTVVEKIIVEETTVSTTTADEATVSTTTIKQNNPDYTLIIAIPIVLGSIAAGSWLFLKWYF